MNSQIENTLTLADNYTKEDIQIAHEHMHTSGKCKSKQR